MEINRDTIQLISAEKLCMIPVYKKWKTSTKINSACNNCIKGMLGWKSGTRMHLRKRLYNGNNNDNDNDSDNNNDNDNNNNKDNNNNNNNNKNNYNYNYNNTQCYCVV